MSKILIYFIFVVSASLSCVTARNLDEQNHGEKTSTKLQSSACGEGGINIGADCNTGSVTLIDDSGRISRIVPETPDRNSQREILNQKHGSSTNRINVGRSSQSASLPVDGNNGDQNSGITIGSGNRGGDVTLGSGGGCGKGGINVGTDCNSGSLTVIDDSGYRRERIGDALGAYSGGVTISDNDRRTDGVIVRYGGSSSGASPGINIGSGSNNRNVIIRDGNVISYEEANVRSGANSEARGSDERSLNVGSGSNSGSVTIRGNGYSGTNINVGSGHNSGDVVLDN